MFKIQGMMKRIVFFLPEWILRSLVLARPQTPQPLKASASTVLCGSFSNVNFS